MTRSELADTLDEVQELRAQRSEDEEVKRQMQRQIDHFKEKSRKLEADAAQHSLESQGIIRRLQNKLRNIYDDAQNAIQQAKDELLRRHFDEIRDNLNETLAVIEEESDAEWETESEESEWETTDSEA